MSGAKIIRSLLAANVPLLNVVPTERIKSGVLPQGIGMPAIGLTDVAGVDRNLPKAGATHHVIDRVQVTVAAATYTDVKTVLALVRTACRDQVGVIAGFNAVTVHTDGKGPDFSLPESGLYFQSQDFRVGYQEPA